LCAAARVDGTAAQKGAPSQTTVKTRMFYVRKRIAETLATKDQVAEARLLSM